MELLIYLILNGNPQQVKCSNGLALTATVSTVQRTVKYTCRKWTSEMHNWQRGYNLPQEDIARLCNNGTVAKESDFCTKPQSEF
ncbi:MAG: hypothetical protein ACK59C_06920 [Holosporales bacterium]|jgi:hypothetical protein